MKKKLSLLLALLMLVPLASCAADPAPAEDTTAAVDTTAPAETMPAQTEPAIPNDKLPTDLNFDGETFYAYTRLKYFYHGEMFIEESNGEQLNDARFDAKTAVAARLNVDFKEDYYGLVDYTDNDAPRNLLLSGDTTYDIFNGRHVNMFNYAAEGLAVNLKDVPYIDLTALWWDEEFSSEVTLGEERYFALGAYNLTTYDSIHMLLFNKKIYADLGIEENRLDGRSIYDVVKDGKWTFDLFNTVAADVSKDLDGDGAMTKTDLYAYVTPAKQVMPSFLLGMDQYMLKKDEDNFLVNNMLENESFYDTFTAILDSMWADSTWFPTIAVTSDAQELEVYDMFKMGQGLFCDSTGGNVSSYRDMDIDFGIIPYPKADETQKNYRARSEYPELFVIPLVCENLELDGAVLEAMSSEYYRSVRPVYFEMSLESRTARDAESADMLEIIYDNRVFDFGDTVFCSDIRDGQIRQMLASNNRSFVSILTKLAPSIQKKLDTLNEGFGQKK